MALWNRLSLALHGHCHALQQQESSVSGSDVDAGREVLRRHGTISREHPWELLHDLSSYRETEEEEQAAAEKAVSQGKFQGE